MEYLLCLLSGQCKTLVTRAIAYCGPQPLGVEMGPRAYRMAGVQLDGIAKAMLPRLRSAGNGGFWVRRTTAAGRGGYFGRCRAVIQLSVLAFALCCIFAADVVRGHAGFGSRLTRKIRFLPATMRHRPSPQRGRLRTRGGDHRRHNPQ